MFATRRAQRIALFGALAALLGIILYSQLANIDELGVVLNSLDAAPISSISMTALGLLATVVGGVAWARRVPRGHSLLSGVGLQQSHPLGAALGASNVHGPTVILMFMVLARAVDCVSMLIVSSSVLLGRGQTSDTQFPVPASAYGLLEAS